MQEMTSSAWKRQGSSLVWHPDLLADLVREIEPTPLRTVVGWVTTAFPDAVPGGHRTVLVGGLQTAVETMMQTQTPDAVAAAPLARMARLRICRPCHGRGSTADAPAAGAFPCRPCAGTAPRT